MKTVYTAGYAGLDPLQLGTKAEELGAMIIDIRFSPSSKDARWRKDALIKTFGPWYRHVQGFGNRNYKGSEIVLADFEKGREEIEKVLVEKPVILLCACWSWALCHRKVVADRLRSVLGVEVVHLIKRDFPELATINPEQESLF